MSKKNENLARQREVQQESITENLATEPTGSAQAIRPTKPKLVTSEIDDGIATAMPVKVGNPASAASLSIDQDHLEDYASDEISTEVPCEKPRKGVYFTVLAETSKPWKNRRFYHLLEFDGRDPYIVAPHIAKLRKDEDVIRPLLLVRYVTMAGDEGLWPVKLDLSEGKSNPWNKSARTILQIASGGKWVRLISAKNHYRHAVSPKTFEQAPPRFSERTYDQLVNLAFAQDHVVASLDHEVWVALDEGSPK